MIPRSLAAGSFINTEQNEDTDDILFSVINFNTDAMIVAETSVDFIKTELKNPDSIKFDDHEAENGEPSIIDGYNFDDKTKLDGFNIVLSDIYDLKDSMNAERFFDQLNDIDLSIFPDAEKIELVI